MGWFGRSKAVGFPIVIGRLLTVEFQDFGFPIVIGRLLAKLTANR